MNLFKGNPFVKKEETKIATNYRQVSEQDRIDSIRNLMGGDLSFKVNNNNSELNKQEQSSFLDLQTKLNNLKNKKL